MNTSPHSTDRNVLEEIKQRHEACARGPGYPDIPESDKEMFNVLAHAYCISVNEDRAWLLDFIARNIMAGQA